MKEPQFYSLIHESTAKYDLLNNPEYIVSIIHRVAGLAGMRLLSTSIVHVGEHGHTHGDPLEYGYSAVGIIATSHIAIHGWPALQFYRLDLVSCKSFNGEEISKFLDDSLSM